MQPLSVFMIIKTSPESNIQRILWSLRKKVVEWRLASTNRETSTTCYHFDWKRIVELLCVGRWEAVICRRGATETKGARTNLETDDPPLYQMKLWSINHKPSTDYCASSGFLESWWISLTTPFSEQALRIHWWCQASGSDCRRNGCEHHMRARTYEWSLNLVHVPREMKQLKYGLPMHPTSTDLNVCRSTSSCELHLARAS
jgi:hypothetical protein